MYCISFLDSCFFSLPLLLFVTRSLCCLAPFSVWCWGMCVLHSDFNRGVSKGSGFGLISFHTVFSVENSKRSSLRTHNLEQVSVQFSRSVVSDSLRPHGMHHFRLPCPSPTPGAYSNSCPLLQWYHRTISSSVIPFSSYIDSFPAICKASSDNHFDFLHFFFSGMVLIPASWTMSWTSVHIPWICLSLPLYNHKGFDLVHTWTTPWFFSTFFQSEFGNKKFMIWATVSF